MLRTKICDYLPSSFTTNVFNLQPSTHPRGAVQIGFPRGHRIGLDERIRTPVIWYPKPAPKPLGHIQLTGLDGGI